MRKQGLNSLPQDHPDGKWHGWNVNKGYWATMCRILTSVLYDRQHNTEFGLCSSLCVKPDSLGGCLAAQRAPAAGDPFYPFESLAPDTCTCLENVLRFTLRRRVHVEILLLSRCKGAQHALQWVKKPQDPSWSNLTSSSGIEIWKDPNPTQTFILRLLRSLACFPHLHVNTELETQWGEATANFSWLWATLSGPLQT